MYCLVFWGAFGAHHPLLAFSTLEIYCYDGLDSIANHIDKEKKPSAQKTGGQKADKRRSIQHNNPTTLLSKRESTMQLGVPKTRNTLKCFYDKAVKLQRSHVFSHSVLSQRNLKAKTIPALRTILTRIVLLTYEDSKKSYNDNGTPF